MNHAARRLAALSAATLLPLAGLAVPASAAAIRVPPGAGSPALEKMRREVGADVPCWRNITIRSTANGRYVTTEIGWDGGDHGSLRARSTTAGPWERFTVCRDPESGVTRIRAQANGDFVSAELDNAGARYGLLRAQADKVGGWERYYSNSPPGEPFSFYARHTRRWVSAEVTFTGNQYGILRARATSVGAEETFVW
ncbi:fascin domain-containing protein [Actinoplanes utahensis]|uniref:Uncharacterized protein n=1 Tax=Actinoplanes utahensis TaxID=1869 RepID=A0A0A6UEF4_ACTUT|nr:hypothetical protein [Actinoplanes utahensis]KHD74410.1 hypothetical protein MB27_28710 [Actinoplanes utahensis]GIF34401.1 hypothetical protein Aut01nite_73870 [Actinoplanes utahensis]